MVRINVVLVEDFKLTRIGLKSTLEQFGTVKIVGEAAKGEEASTVIEKCNPDVVICDIGLPQKSGIETISEIHQKFPDIKIIMLTSHTNENEILQSLGNGASAYCLKSITPEHLTNVIEMVYHGAVWVDPVISNVVLNKFPKPDTIGEITIRPVEDYKSKLTEREYEVLKLLVDGKSNTEIAKELIVSVHTAKAHVCSILQKLTVTDRVQAAVKAIKENIV